MSGRPAWARGAWSVFLWLSLPIAVLAMAASAAGMFAASTYASETSGWAAQAVGQDSVNLVLAYPTLLVLAWLAGRGSLRAHLAWLGVLAYSAYSYLLYAGFVHFSGWFLAYVVVLGLSVYALIGGLAVLRVGAVAAAFSPRTPTRAAGGLLVAFGALFALLWLAEIVPAALAGEPLASASDAGLPTNPVYLLDLAIFLPAMVVAGVLLWRRQPLGYVLAVPLYVCGAVMGTAVLAMAAVLAASGEPFAVPPVLLMGAATFVKVTVGVRLLTALRARDLSPAAPPVRSPDDRIAVRGAP